MTDSSLLRIDGLSVAYTHRGGASVPAVSELDLTVRPGSMTAVVGESGSGKSTTANAAIGLLPPSARVANGQIRLGDLDLLSLGTSGWRGVRGSQIGYVPQDPGSSLNPLQTIGKSVAEALRIHRRANRAEARAQVIELLDRVGIDQPEKRADQFPHELSGGMRQRVLIAAAIALRPRLLIADEPTSALDVTVQKQVLDLLDELRAETGMGVLFITHDLAVAGERADEVVVMQGGRIVESGHAGRVFSDPATESPARLIADAARRSGVELREVLTMLRSDDQGTVIDPDIDRLVAARGDTAELRYLEPVTAAALHRCGALEQTTIYRFVQEAITNAVKHAPGQKVTIKVGFDEADGHLELTASNPHTGLAPAFRAGAQQLVTGSGLGLLGLRERMEAMGGDLTVTTTPEFTLRARIPIDADVLTDDDSAGTADTAGSHDEQEKA
ncbi:ATP-binding cassette domain-containing protein [Brevibacterium epidermidis]|uniref:ATP-binding cassette domain-containing protein n=1 Tax=Brevibacterium epidermidis TaxID=1698 RepID=UPI000BF5075A|nr:ATP-binding cassette domain-containing protein [Brevibacterium epidermidis]